MLTKSYTFLTSLNITKHKIYMTSGVPSRFKKLLDVSSETNYR